MSHVFLADALAKERAALRLMLLDLNSETPDRIAERLRAAAASRSNAQLGVRFGQV